MSRVVSMLVRLPRVCAMSPASLASVGAARPTASPYTHQLRCQSSAAAMPLSSAPPRVNASSSSGAAPPRISKTIRRTADVKVAPTVVLPPPPAAGGKSSSCSTEQPVEVRPLSALERRQRPYHTAATNSSQACIDGRICDRPARWCDEAWLQWIQLHHELLLRLRSQT